MAPIFAWFALFCTYYNKNEQRYYLTVHFLRLTYTSMFSACLQTNINFKNYL